MYIYHALINALSVHMIHINLNMIFYTHVEHSPTKTIYIKYYLNTHTVTQWCCAPSDSSEWEPCGAIRLMTALATCTESTRARPTMKGWLNSPPPPPPPPTLRNMFFLEYRIHDGRSTTKRDVVSDRYGRCTYWLWPSASPKRPYDSWSSSHWRKLP